MKDNSLMGDSEKKTSQTASSETDISRSEISKKEKTKQAKEAAQSGYIGKDGKAVSMARKDIEGSPTGAYTDIGHGRSSVVHKKDESRDKTVEDAPEPHGEQAP